MSLLIARYTYTRRSGGSTPEMLGAKAVCERRELTHIAGPTHSIKRSCETCRRLCSAREVEYKVTKKNSISD